VTFAGRDGGVGIRATLPSVAARLPAFLAKQRWFGGKERAVERVEIRDTAVVPDHPSALLAIVDVRSEAGMDTYFLPLGLADPLSAEVAGEIVARHGDLVVRDAIGDPATCRALLRGMLDGRTLATDLGGRFVFEPAKRQQAPGAAPDDAVDPDALAVRHAGVEQSNSSVIFGSTFILKALRRLATGTSPEIEIPRFLGEHTAFDRVPALVGWAEYRAPDGTAAPVAVLQHFVPNQGDGWAHVLRTISGEEGHPAGDLVSEIADLGRTLGELHLALASRPDVPAFAPEPIGPDDVEQWQRRTRASLDAMLARAEAGAVVRDGAKRLRAAIDGIAVLADGVTAKTRHHGDFHLGQTLVAPDGWILIDFEGEPLRSLAERRAKQTPLRDLAGLLRSLDYARATAERTSPPAGAMNRAPTRDDLADLFGRCREALLVAYVATVRAGGAPLLPRRPEDFDRVLLALEVEKALYELAYELGNRPDWVPIPLGALARLARTPSS
jgi:maltose alpha-D-glucosyltransferase/alpha-amylase